MENNASPLETLFERAEDYGKTTLTLLKLDAVDKSANMLSFIVIKLILLLVGALFLLTLSIGLSLWVGELLGKAYYGFFTITGFYIVIGFVLYLFRDAWIGTHVRNAVIVEMLKKKSI